MGLLEVLGLLAPALVNLWKGGGQAQPATQPLQQNSALSWLPYIGAAGAGGLAGAALSQGSTSGIGQFFGGIPGTDKQFQRFTPQQQAAFSQIIPQALQGISQVGDLSFDPIAAKARQDFAQKTIPTIAERYTAMGIGPRSSGYLQTLSQAGSDLESNLAAQRSAYGLQQNKALQSLLALGLTPQFESAYIKRQPGFLENTAQGALAALPYLSKS